MKEKSVAIILVNWNQKKDLVECLGSIKDLQYSNFKVFLVDNNSMDNSLNEAKNAYKGNMKIVKNRRNVGFAGANNIGMKYALRENYDYIMLLNTDTVIERGGLRKMIQYLNKQKEVSAISPLILFYNKKDMVSYAGGLICRNLRHISHRGAYEIDCGQFNEPISIDFLTGCCLVVRSEILRKVGFFDERFFMYFEDTDLSLRLKRYNYKIEYFPYARIWHKIASGEALKKKFYYNYYMGRNRLLLIRNHKPKLLFSEIPYTIMKSIYNLLRIRFISGFAGIKAAIDFMANKTGKL